jgi:sugar phosphate isomerase/epimerase
MTMRGPGVMLSQFMGDGPPFDSLEAVVRWLAGHGYVGVQVPVHDARLIDLERAAADNAYCRDYIARLADLGVEVTELAAHRSGQLTAVNPAFTVLNDAFAAPALRGDPAARTAWAERQLRLAIEAAARLGLQRVATFSGAFVWPYFYPWPPAPAGLV